jgi:hypothetical protein
VCIPNTNFLQDYLGAFIVFAAIFTSLISAYIFPENIQSSMVGLAINYTLLIPIYLNWVVKLLSDLEMYFGAFERIRYYIENGFHEEKSMNREICKLEGIVRDQSFIYGFY